MPILMFMFLSIDFGAHGGMKLNFIDPMGCDNALLYLNYN